MRWVAETAWADWPQMASSTNVMSKTRYLDGIFILGKCVALLDRLPCPSLSRALSNPFRDKVGILQFAIIFLN